MHVERKHDTRETPAVYIKKHKCYFVCTKRYVSFELVSMASRLDLYRALSSSSAGCIVIPSEVQQLGSWLLVRTLSDSRL